MSRDACAFVLAFSVHGSELRICKPRKPFAPRSNPPRPIRLFLSLMHHTVAVVGHCHKLKPPCSKTMKHKPKSHDRSHLALEE